MAEVMPKDVLLRVGCTPHGVVTVGGARRSLVSPPFTFARASDGYYLDRDGIIRKASSGKMRMYWTPGLGKAGIALERARTNGWTTNTENYNHADWTRNTAVTITPNAGTAPNDVVLSADKIVETATTNIHIVGRLTPALTDNTRTAVWWLVKAAERTWVYIRTIDKAGTARSTWFNLATGALGTKNAGHDAWIKPLGATLGYYLVAVSFDAASGGGSPAADLGLATGDNASSYAGDGTSGIFLWESAVEVDRQWPSLPGSILPNGLARAADRLIVPFNFGAIDFTIFAAMARPMHVDVTGTIAGNSSHIYKMDPANLPNLRGVFATATRSWTATIDTAGTDASASGSWGAEAELQYCAQYQNLGTTGGLSRLSNGGSTFAADAGPATPFPNAKFGGQNINLSLDNFEPDIVLHDLMIDRGLFTRDESLAVAA